MADTDNSHVREVEDENEDLSKMTPIQNKYTFWFRGGSGNASKAQVINYQESIKKISSFQTVEHFWHIYDHLKRPNEFRVTTEYHLFKEGITPTWEDAQNKAGGKWMVRLKKGIASRYWEDVVLAVIGEQFDVGPEICGAVISVRNNEDIISIWNKTADNTEAVNKIRDQLRRIWKLPSIIPIEYKRHQDSLVDKSSYRNPTMVWRAPAKTTGTMGEPNKPQGGYNKDGKPHYNNNSNYQRAEGGDNSQFPKAAWKPTREGGEQGGSRFNSQSGWNKPAPVAARDSNGETAEDRSKSLDERKGFTKINISSWQRKTGGEEGGELKSPTAHGSEEAPAASKVNAWARGSAVSAGADK